MEQVLRLNDALYNAGLLGFLRVMKSMDDLYETPSGAELTVDFSVFEDGRFTQAYLQTLLKTYKKHTKYQALMEEIGRFLDESRAIPDAKDEAYKALVKSVKTKLSSASYKAAYEIIAHDAEMPFDFVPLVEKWKSAKEPDIQIPILRELYERLKQYGDIFALKDIIYNFVQPYWSGVSFLHKNKNKIPFSQAFEGDFIQPILSSKPKKGKKVYHCLQCDAVLPGTPANSGMAWINDLGVNVSKKNNDFWQMKPDFAPCPLCSLIYACIPLGFQSMAYEGVFINCNSSFLQLEQMNAPLDAGNSEQSSFAALINQFVAAVNKQEAKQKLENVQVVRRSRKENRDWAYRVNIFSPKLLRNLKSCETELQWLAEKAPWLHRMVINDILDGKSLYPLLYREYRKNLKQNRPLYIYFTVLRIQIVMFGKAAGKDTCDMNKTILRAYLKQARDEGEKLQKEISARVNDKKGITLSYGLLNALQTGDCNQFLQMVMRRYLSMGKEIPELFIQTITDEEAFLAIGNAFLIGLSQDNAKNGEKETKE